MIDQQIDIQTKDGKTTTFISHPERGGPFPIILFYMDAPAIREELRDMARRLATSGYYVMLPNMYYRKGVMELGPLPADPESPERKRMFELMHSLSIPLVMDDTRALLDFAATQEAAQQGADRHRRLLHERTIRHQRRDAFSGPRQGGGIDLWRGACDRQAGQPAPRREKDQGRALFRLRRNRRLRADGNRREGQSSR